MSTNEEVQQPTKNEQISTAVDRIVYLLNEIETLQEDIKTVAAHVAEKFDMKPALITALAKEKHAGSSTKAIEKHQDVVDLLSTLPEQ